MYPPMKNPFAPKASSNSTQPAPAQHYMPNPYAPGNQHQTHDARPNRTYGHGGPQSRPNGHGKWDVSNRPAGDRQVNVNTDIDVLTELCLGFAFLMTDDPDLQPDENDKERLQQALQSLLISARTKYRGRHPNDIALPDVTGHDGLINLIEALDRLRTIVGVRKPI